MFCSIRYVRNKLQRDGLVCNKFDLFWVKPFYSISFFQVILQAPYPNKNCKQFVFKLLWGFDSCDRVLMSIPVI